MHTYRRLDSLARRSNAVAPTPPPHANEETSSPYASAAGDTPEKKCERHVIIHTAHQRRCDAKQHTRQPSCSHPAVLHPELSETCSRASTLGSRKRALTRGAARPSSHTPPVARALPIPFVQTPPPLWTREEQIPGLFHVATVVATERGHDGHHREAHQLLPGDERADPRAATTAIITTTLSLSLVVLELLSGPVPRSCSGRRTNHLSAFDRPSFGGGGGPPGDLYIAGSREPTT